MSNLFWVTEVQMARLQPFFPRLPTSVTGTYQSRPFRHRTSAAGCAVFIHSAL